MQTNPISANVYLTRLLPHTPLGDSSRLLISQIPPDVIPLPDFWESHRRGIWDKSVGKESIRGLWGRNLTWWVHSECVLIYIYVMGMVSVRSTCEWCLINAQLLCVQYISNVWRCMVHVWSVRGEKITMCVHTLSKHWSHNNHALITHLPYINHVYIYIYIHIYRTVIICYSMGSHVGFILLWALDQDLSTIGGVHHQNRSASPQPRLP